MHWHTDAKYCTLHVCALFHLHAAARQVLTPEAPGLTQSHQGYALVSDFVVRVCYGSVQRTHVCFIDCECNVAAVPYALVCMLCSNGRQARPQDGSPVTVCVCHVITATIHRSYDASSAGQWPQPVPQQRWNFGNQPHHSRITGTLNLDHGNVCTFGEP